MLSLQSARLKAGSQDRCRRPHAARLHSHHRRRAQQLTCRSLVDEYLIKPITSAGQNPVLNAGIRQFYDQSSGLWEKMWGEHMHHGFYDPTSKVQKSRVQAQIDMIENTLATAGVTKATRIVDVGCGVGGSSRYLCRKFKAASEGITLSPVQAQRANEMSAAAGLGDVCNFRVGDALKQPFANDSFDLAWSMESGEHMPDKRQFVSELVRVTKPGGKVIIVTWCHRNLLPGEPSLRPDEISLLDRINEAYYLPQWCSLDDYRALFDEFGVEDVRTADWSKNVAPFWQEVIKSALTPAGFQGLLGAGWDTIKGAMVMPLMARGFEMGTIKFVLISGTIPGGASAQTSDSVFEATPAPEANGSPAANGMPAATGQ